MLVKQQQRRTDVVFACQQINTYRHGVTSSCLLRCYHTGSGETRSKGIKNSDSLLWGCQFALRISLSGHIYTVEISSHIHNHPPSRSSNDYPSVRWATETDKENIAHKSELGIQPRTILAELRQEGSKAAIKTVYNCLLKHRSLQLEGQMPASALLELLHGEAKYQISEEGQ